ncbi:hypothetical protein HK102_002953 [Quaeritorhiza haematococci]|nr:hypothetical protein HK102_002953 [Quaeritorhiza haematococci]
MSSAQVPIFKKSKLAGKNIRKRQRSPSPPADEPSRSKDIDASDDGSTTIIRKKRDGKPSAFTSSTSTYRKKQQKEAEKLEVGGVSFAASGSAASLVGNSATRTLDVDGAEELQEGAILTPLADEDEGLYKGMNKYKEYVNKKVEKTTQSNASSIRAGPLRGPTNIRISCRFDYQPDICKDYKETGYCGYGDSCKFMHDRGDYKTGWQLEKEWEEKEKAIKAGRDAANKWLIEEEGGGAGEGSDDEDELPFACLICRMEFKDPVVTKCGHYFCESCALKNHAKSPKCFACATPTMGMFSVAKNLKAKLAEKKKRMEEREKEIRESMKDVEENEEEDGE